jgi:tetratricopeptide (TPR) repeat protein
MFKYVALAAALMLAGVSCSKAGKAENLIKQGKYEPAIELLQKVLTDDPKDVRATALMVRAHAFLNISRADSAIQAADFEKALQFLSQAVLEDTVLAKPKIEAVGSAIINYVGKQLVPEKNWAAALRHLDLLAPFQVSLSSIAVLKARILLARDNRYSWPVVEAFETARQLDAGAEDITKVFNEIQEKKAPFLKQFSGYYGNIINKNYSAWQRQIDANYVENIKADIKRIMENQPELKLSSVKDYFDQFVATEPEMQGSASGPAIVAIDLASPSEATVHYTFPKMAWNEKVTMKSGRFTRPERSEKPKQL